jgi:hypothetical protein
MSRPCFFSDQSIIDRSQPPSFQSAIQNALIAQLHVHNYERWFGASAGNVAPGLLNSLTPFTITSGGSAGVFGTPIQVFNGTETPVQSFAKLFDFHRLQIAGISQTGPVFWHIVIADSSGGATSYAQAVAMGNYTEIIAVLTVPAIPFEIMSIRHPAGTQLWANLATSFAGSANLNFFVGIHEYAK